ncbi:hypothetical protein CDN99_18650 [Roseateles aquatilis]|uniref:DUF2975 domain-containing protein n=1 Tax=Roseateles aquatilis TaxID=431061 RepID=A0A246J4V7_9BURK|nr:DUF2975 domain-containing protein [Roseateles aquatilis]OWQ87609.1 hypothetical protein CDN99_18650 [Roseateles aquatilis]
MAIHPASPLPDGLKRILWISRCVRALSLVGMATVALFFARFWSDADWIRKSVDSDWCNSCKTLSLDAASRALAALGTSPALVLTLVAFWQLWRLFGHFQRGNVFTTAAIAHLRRLSQALIAMAAVMPLSSTLAILALTMRNPPGQRVLVFQIGSQHYLQLLVGLVLLAMALVMQEARRMAQENAEFV